MNSPEQLAAHADLWESGLWKLCKTRESRGRVVIHFGGSGPTLRDVQALRLLSQERRDLPASDVLSEVRGKDRLVLGEFRTTTALKLQREAARAGLKAELEDCSCDSYLILRKDGGAAELIENEELAEAIRKEMLRRGVEVQVAEAD